MRRKRLVLLVHADDASRVTLQVILKREGYAVLEASNAAQALAQLEDSLPDLLIADIRGNRKSGLELIRTVRSQDRYGKMRILGLTGKTGSADSVPEGVDDVHAGPLATQQLVRQVAALIGRA